MRFKFRDCEKLHKIIHKLTSCAFGCSWLQIFLVCSSDKAKVDSMNIDCSSSSAVNCEQDIFLRKTFPKYFSLSISFGGNQSTLFTTRHFSTRQLATSREWKILLATTRTSDTELNNFSRLIHDFFIYILCSDFNPKYLLNPKRVDVLVRTCNISLQA